MSIDETSAQAALRMTKEVIHFYYEHEAKPIEALLGENAVWIGPFEFQWTENLPAFLTSVRAFPDSRQPFLSRESYRLLGQWTDSCLVCGSFVSSWLAGERTRMVAQARVSCLWQEAMGRLQISHMHISYSGSYRADAALLDSWGMRGQTPPFGLDSHSVTPKKLEFHSQDKQLYQLFPDEIIRAESSGIYCTIFLPDGTSFVTRCALSRLQELLGPQFIRSHRSHLVNAACIRQCRNCRMSLEDGTILPIAKDRFRAVRQEIIGQQSKGNLPYAKTE